jgi:integrase
MKDVEVAFPKHVFVTYHNRDLTKEDIRKILDHTSLRDKVFFLMLAESGMRPDTLVQLTYSNIKQEYEKGIVPMKIELPSLILKDNPQARFTFIGEDSARLLREYLSGRGKLEDDDFIFQPIRPKNLKEKLRMESFSLNFGRIVRKIGLVKAGSKEDRKPKEIRLYGLRKYFNNNMRADRAYIEFWMGHTDTKSHYVSNNAEEHRKRYVEGYQFLRIYEPITETALIIQEQKKEIEALKQTLAMRETTREADKKRLDELEATVKEITRLFKELQEERKKNITPKGP